MRHKKKHESITFHECPAQDMQVPPFFCQDLLPVAHKSLRIAFTRATLEYIASVARPVCKSRTLASLMSHSWSIKSLLICYRGSGRESWPGMWDLLRHIKPLPRSHLLDVKYTLGINRRSGYVREEALNNARASCAGGWCFRSAWSRVRAGLNECFSAGGDRAATGRSLFSVKRVHFFFWEFTMKVKDFLPYGCPVSYRLAVRAQTWSVHTSYRCLL